MVDPSRLEQDLSLIRNKYGIESVLKGSQFPEIPRIPTGSLELDYATGGGIPIGRFARFYGGFSSGKTLTCWNIIREAQAMGLVCVYYNIEKQFHREFVEARGVDVDKLIVVEGTIAEEIGTKLETLLGSAHIHVLDSCSSVVSVDELSASLEDWSRALIPRVFGKVFRRALERFDAKENTVIVIDQIRDSMTYGGGERAPGGRLLEHQSSLTLHFRKGKWLYKDDSGMMKEPSKENFGEQPDGQECVVRVQKSRVCRPFREARMHLDLETLKFDPLFELEKAAKYHKIVKASGSWYELPDGSKVQGTKQLRKYIDDHEEFAEKIRQVVLS